MSISVNPSIINGSIRIPSSKSLMHRMLICAALADRQTLITCCGRSKDIEATCNCLSAMSAGINCTRKDGACYEYLITPIFGKTSEILDCGECGSTLRFLLPVNAALGSDAVFTGHGRLMQRPIGALLDELSKHGAVFRQYENQIRVSGGLLPGIYSIPGNISSQYISGLLMALPVLDKDSVIKLTTEEESTSYIDITMDVLKRFGVRIERKDDGFYVFSYGRYSSPGTVTVEGDWSNAAFWITGGAMASEEGLYVNGLNISSTQGDKKIVDILKQMGADIMVGDDGVMVKKSEMHGMDIDASDIPDLVPILSVAASAARGVTRIFNAGRLRLKESDRIESTVSMINNLGGRAVAKDDSLIIHGKEQSGLDTVLTSGTVDSYNDHRIVMAAAIASLVSNGPVVIEDERAVEKSYPDFFEHFSILTGA